MSYCRFHGKSDVYVYGTGEEMVCCSCRLAPPEIFFSALMGKVTTCRTNEVYDTFGGILRHLYDHIEAGHRVPNYAIKRIKKEMKEYGLSLISPKYQAKRDQNRMEWVQFWMEHWDEDNLSESLEKFKAKKMLT